MIRWRSLAAQDGAILPLVALLLFVLFGFAMLGVDATAAYAERRQAQSAADAAVLAAALDYLADDSPTGNDLAVVIKQYVVANWGSKAPSDAEWASCVDSNRPADYSPIVDASVVPAVTISDCISLKQVNGEPALLRVHLPDHGMKTSFASLFGFNTVDITATATAELRYAENTKILPFSLPADAGNEECLATPPSGLLSQDETPCDGPVQGNFGLIDSPWFGADDPHFTNGQACPSDPNFNTKAPHNIAIGLDHVITSWPSPPAQPSVGVNQPNNHPGADSCASATNGTVPYVLLTQPGNTQTAAGKALLQLGFLGDDPSPTPANLPGRLRQDSSPDASGSRLAIDTSSWDFDVDNVGLWEYLLNTGSASDACDSTNFSGKIGRELTIQLTDCLENSVPEFNEDLLDSPRFAIVPMLNYAKGAQFGNKWWAVLELRPVYLQTTWYDCTNGGDKGCLFQPDDFTPDPSDRDSYSLLFNPGEGSASPCYLNGGSCVTPQTNRFQLMGISAFVLDWDQLPPGAENQYGSNAPFEVFLHDNE